ncbi:MAG TPA: hypothetical protein VJY35_09350 [Candidatus Eisenbacteria bacterium]|nr:hypothetical protein [Candidatus Eisenbacteria bacterium]
MKSPVREGREDRREPAGESGDADAVVGLVLGHPVRAFAEGVHGVVAGGQVELALVDLGHHADQFGGGEPVPCEEGTEQLQ